MLILFHFLSAGAQAEIEQQYAQSMIKLAEKYGAKRRTSVSNAKGEVKTTLSDLWDTTIKATRVRADAHAMYATALSQRVRPS